MNHPITLGTLKVGKDPITIELIEEPDIFPLVRVTWPSTGLSVGARKFPDVAAAITRVFANASIELARIKGRRLFSVRSLGAGFPSQRPRLIWVDANATRPGEGKP